MGLLTLSFGRPLLGIYNSNEEIIAWGMIRLKFLLTTYFLCGIMDVISGALRGLGHSFKPMIVMLIGVCVFRIFWVKVVFSSFRSLECLVVSYPVSWSLVIICNGLMLYIILQRMLKDAAKRKKKTLLDAVPRSSKAS